MRLFPILALFAAAFCALTPALLAQREKFSPDDLDTIYKKWPTIEQTNTGIRYVILKEGKGRPPAPGDLVSVLYEGSLLNGSVFDRLADHDHPMVFRVGRNKVIEGWDQVLPLMKPGEKRLVVIPPELAYGAVGRPPRIPREASLVFTIELLGVKREQ